MERRPTGQGPPRPRHNMVVGFPGFSFCLMYPRLVAGEIRDPGKPTDGQFKKSRDAWLAQSPKQATLDLLVLRSSPTLAVEIPKKNNF